MKQHHTTRLRHHTHNAPQQRLGRHHHEGLAAGAEQLAAEGMEVVGRRRRVLDEEVGVDYGRGVVVAASRGGACGWVGMVSLSIDAHIHHIHAYTPGGGDGTSLLSCKNRSRRALLCSGPAPS
jgi:hypothetical protein